jgi:hypothetical protein
VLHRVAITNRSIDSTIPDDGIETFSRDYFLARERFLEHAVAAEASLESHPISAPGPRGERLFIDVARFGDERAASALVVTSGVHGVEGFLGSAVQLAMLRNGLGRTFPGRNAQLILIHAINPWGFAHLRRVNEDNVDPNRNLMFDSDAYVQAPVGYANADRHLNPRRPPSKLSDAAFLLLSASHVCRFGMRHCKQIVATGQYEYPHGLFYGGQQPIESHRILRAGVPHWLGGADRVLHLDFHTGLGRWASHCLLLDMTIDAGRLKWLQRVFGKAPIESFEGDVAGYEVRGSLGKWSQKTLPHCEYTYLCAEFGTYSPFRMLHGLRAENQAYHWCDADSPARHLTRQRLAELFCPASRTWRTRALRVSLELVRQAVQALES